MQRIISPENAAGLAKAIAAAGSRGALARKLGLTRHAVRSWVEVPAVRVIEVAAVTGLAIEELRPVTYPQPATALRLAAA